MRSSTKMASSALMVSAAAAGEHRVVPEGRWGLVVKRMVRPRDQEARALGPKRGRCPEALQSRCHVIPATTGRARALSERRNHGDDVGASPGATIWVRECVNPSFSMELEIAAPRDRLVDVWRFWRTHARTPQDYVLTMGATSGLLGIRSPSCVAPQKRLRVD